MHIQDIIDGESVKSDKSGTAPHGEKVLDVNHKHPLMSNYSSTLKLTFVLVTCLHAQYQEVALDQDVYIQGKLNNTSSPGIYIPVKSGHLWSQVNRVHPRCMVYSTESSACPLFYIRSAAFYTTNCCIAGNIGEN